MKCSKEYLPLLSGHIDGTNSEVEERRLQKHLKSCKECRALLEQLEQTELLFAEAAATPPADLTARIMDAVRKEPKKRSRKRFYASFASAGLATAALLALVFFGNTPLPTFSADSAAEENYVAPVVTYSSQNEQHTVLGQNDYNIPTDKGYGAVAEPEDKNITVEISSDEATDYTEYTVFSSQEATEASQPESTAYETVPESTDSTPVPSQETPESTDSTPVPSQETPESTQANTTETVLESSDAEPTDGETASPTERNTEDGVTLSGDVSQFYYGDDSSLHAAITGGTENHGSSILKGQNTVTQELPTLVIWEAVPERFPELAFAPMEKRMPQLSVITEESTFYERFLSILPSQLLFLRSNALRSTPDFDLTRYTVPYEDFTALIQSAAGKYAFAVYFPQELDTEEECLVILIRTEE